ncbi:antibiotic ABC transporter permease [Wenjunlia vitaminophila]|uniref:Transport permease protein n=1 Tax=Wenjunlia vitaminophila TaxID=76728 RepID=A0A0T6LWW9_WENVI|nr:ABC transporter permease [Wenjunlia vitaminophila]KRV50550.1 antibiotic ABC transporter permease [Wenjunlia vitaminophila]
MNASVTLSTARRVLGQLRHDRRTAAMVLIMPAVLMVLLRYVFDSQRQFERIAPALLGILAFLVMFMVTSVATLRERTGGTLERLMTTPAGRFDLLSGYAIAFSLLAVAQVALAVGVSLTWLGLEITGSTVMVFVVAALDAVLGTALGLFVSAFARTEFQAMQFMPVVVLPQALVCGLFTPREDMNQVLTWFSDAMPLSYAVDAMNKVTRSSEFTQSLWVSLAVIVGSLFVSLVLGAATLRRRTP